METETYSSYKLNDLDETEDEPKKGVHVFLIIYELTLLHRKAIN